MGPREDRSRAIRMFGLGRCKTGKIIFPAHWKAQVYRKALSAPGTREYPAGRVLVEYRCGLCGAWHVGHRDEPGGASK